jgi:hypothetical protein
MKKPRANKIVPRAETATPSTAKPPEGWQDPEIEAANLFRQLEQERGTDAISLGKAVKGYSARAAIVAAEPAVRVAFVRQVVATFVRLGKSTGKIPMVSAWFNDTKVPFGAEEVAKQLMRRRLPFTDAMLAEMVEQIGQMDFVTFAPVLEPLVRELEKRAAEGALSPNLRKLLPQVVNGLLVKGWTAEEKENWGLPRPADRKLATRIQSLLGGK